MTIIPPAPTPVDVTALLPRDGSRPMTGTIQWGDPTYVGVEGEVGINGGYFQAGGDSADPYMDWSPIYISMGIGNTGFSVRSDLGLQFSNYVNFAKLAIDAYNNRLLIGLGQGQIDYGAISVSHWNDSGQAGHSPLTIYHDGSMSWGDGQAAQDVSLKRVADISSPGLQLTGELYIGLDSAYSAAGIEFSSNYGLASIYGQDANFARYFNLSGFGLDFSTPTGGGVVGPTRLAAGHLFEDGATFDWNADYGVSMAGPSGGQLYLSPNDGFNQGFMGFTLLLSDAEAPANPDVLRFAHFNGGQGLGSVPKFAMKHDGKMSWGNGVLAPDLSLERLYGGALGLSGNEGTGYSELVLGTASGSAIFDGPFIDMWAAADFSGSPGAQFGIQTVHGQVVAVSNDSANELHVLDAGGQIATLAPQGLTLNSPNGSKTKTFSVDNTGAFAGAPKATVIRKVTATGSINLNDETILVDATAGDMTLTLPAGATAPGRQFRIIRLDSYFDDGKNFSVLPAGTDTIMGADSSNPWVIRRDGGLFVNDGSNWAAV